MRVIIKSFVLSILTLLILYACVRANANGELNEVQKLKAQNSQLRIQLLQCQVTMTNQQLSAERVALVEEFRKTLSAKPEQEFDWEKLTFKDAEKKDSEK